MTGCFPSQCYCDCHRPIWNSLYPPKCYCTCNTKVTTNYVHTDVSQLKCLLCNHKEEEIAYHAAKISTINERMDKAWDEIHELREHHVRQIYENRKASRRIDEIEAIKGIVAPALDKTLCRIDERLDALEKSKGFIGSDEHTKIWNEIAAIRESKIENTEDWVEKELVCRLCGKKCAEFRYSKYDLYISFYISCENCHKKLMSG
jgi:hypothetical protein